MSTAPAWSLPERWDAVLVHRDRALRVARARLSDPYDVDDCVQESMARVVAMPNLDLGRVGPLLSTVVANVAADTHRQHVRASRLTSKVTSSAVPLQPGDEPVCDAAEARWLHSQLHTLGARERAVLELRAEGRTVAETAAALGMTYKAVESAFTRGRNALKTLWRSTLVAVAVCVRRAWRTPEAGISAAAFAAAAVLGLAVAQSGVASGRPSATARPAQDTPVASIRADAQPTVGRSPSAPSRGLHRRPGAAARQTQLAVVPRQAVGPVGSIYVRETREHGEETFAQTLERCAKKGITVSPSKIRCNA